MASIGRQGSNRFWSGGVFIKKTYGEAGAIVATDMFFGPSAPSSVLGSLSATESQDTASVSGNVVAVVSGTMSATETQDTASLAGSVSIGGSFTATDAQDSTAMSGGVVVSGQLVCVDTPDTDTITGDIDISGTLITVDAQDSASVAGSVEALPISGMLDATEDQDSVAVAGSVEGGQPNHVSGSIPGWKAKQKPTVGSMSVIESPDGCRIIGNISITAGMTAAEPQDGASAIVAIEPYRRFRQRKDDEAVIAWLMAA